MASSFQSDINLSRKGLDHLRALVATCFHLRRSTRVKHYLFLQLENLPCLETADKRWLLRRRWRTQIVLQMMVLLACLRCICGYAQLAEVDETSASFALIPELIRVGDDGKYPETHVVLFHIGCQQGTDGSWSKDLPDGDLTLRLSGNISNPNGVNHDKCTVWFDLKTASASHGTVAVQVLNGSKSLGYGFLHLADPAAKPVPTVPQVDVLWAPIGHRTCTKAFGRSVANNFWCIAVRIGNNSGYQLQIAGVGFKGKEGTRNTNTKTPNSSYALTRAVAQEGASNSGRAFLINSVSATGLLMAGFSPYFHNERSAAKYNAGTSIVSGPLSAALGLIWPDAALRTSNNLDDQSLRDGRLIPNNTQITTVVFLDKGSIIPDYISACKSVFRQYAENPAQGFDSRQGIDAVQKAINDKDSAAAYDFKKCVQGRTSPGLKEALGDLVLVGDQVAYLQRIVVDQSVQSQELLVGAQPTGSSVSYTTVTISAVAPERLPLSVTVRGPDGKAEVGTDGKIVGSTATYTLAKPLQNGSYVITDMGGNIRIPLSGIVKNPDIRVDKVEVKGSQLFVTGDNLKLLPEKLVIKIDNKTFDAESAERKDMSATFSLKSALDPGKKFTIVSDDGFPLKEVGGTVSNP